MRIIDRTPRFKRSLRKFIKNNPRLYEKIEQVLEQMIENPFAPFLFTHSLGGALSGVLACSCGYDCRILFTINRDKKTGDETIVLLNIGTHDIVY